MIDDSEQYQGRGDVHVQTISRGGCALQSARCYGPCEIVIETPKRKLTIKIRKDGTIGKVQKDEK